MRTRTLAFALLTGLLIGVPTGASAQWDDPGAFPDTTTREQSRMQWGGRIGFGSAQAGRATDEFGDPSLLFGTAYTGNGLRFSGVGRYHFSDNIALRFELGFMRSHTSGFADTDTYRRDLTFDLWSLDVPVALDAGARVGPLSIRGIAGIGPRFGVSASAREERTAAVPPEPALEIRTGLALPLHLGAEFAVHTNGNLSIPIEFRYMRNFGYPDKTEDRFDDYTNEEDRGRFLVENDWHFLVQVGVDVRPGAREPRSTFVEPPPPPPPPPPPAQPDQDGDGIFDALDACPLEPSQAGQPMPAPGCPASGGIVQLSCDRVWVSVPIEFESGLDTIKPESYPILYLLADTLQIAQNVTLLSIEGHTDDVGDADENQWLSEWRAYSVLEFLIEAGVEESRLQSFGYGEEYPLESNDTSEGRAANRRVEFHILENQTCDF